MARSDSPYLRRSPNYKAPTKSSSSSSSSGSSSKYRTISASTKAGSGVTNITEGGVSRTVTSKKKSSGSSSRSIGKTTNDITRTATITKSTPTQPTAISSAFTNAQKQQQQNIQNFFSKTPSTISNASTAASKITLKKIQDKKSEKTQNTQKENAKKLDAEREAKFQAKKESNLNTFGVKKKLSLTQIANAYKEKFIDDVVNRKAVSDVKKGSIAMKELLPFLNRDSLTTYAKIANKEAFNKKDALNLIFDFVSIIPVAAGAGKAIKGSKIGLKSLSKLKIGGKAITEIAKTQKAFQNSLKVANKIGNLPGIRGHKLATNLLKASITIADDAGFARRLQNSAMGLYQVDKSYLTKIAKQTTIANPTDTNLYKTYISYVGSATNDKKFKTDDITSLIGVDYFKKDTLVKGQARFENYLKANGLNNKDTLKTIKELENYRSSRLIAQIGGALKVEVSSERLGQRLLSKGVSKKTALGIAGGREALGEMAQELVTNDYKPEDMIFFKGALKIPKEAVAIGNVILGAQGAKFFSIMKGKKLSSSAIKKAENKLINNVFKNTPKVKQKAFIIKATNKLKTSPNLKRTKLELNDLFGKATTAKDKKLIKGLQTSINNPQKFINKDLQTKLFKKHIKKTLTEARGGTLISKKGKSKFESVGKYLLGNVIDPYEFIGDTIFDIQEEILSGINKKLKSTKFKRLNVKTLVSIKTKSKTPATTKSQTKSKTPATTKSQTKSKSENKSKSESQTDTKSETDTKTDTRAETDTNTDTNANTQTKTETNTDTNTNTNTDVSVRITTVKFPYFYFGKVKGTLKSKERPSFKSYIIKNGKPTLFKKDLPINKILKETALFVKANDKYKEFYIKLDTKTINKDIATPSIIKDFDLIQNKNLKRVVFKKKQPKMVKTTATVNRNTKTTTIKKQGAKNRTIKKKPSTKKKMVKTTATVNRNTKTTTIKKGKTIKRVVKPKKVSKKKITKTKKKKATMTKTTKKKPSKKVSKPKTTKKKKNGKKKSKK